MSSLNDGWIKCTKDNQPPVGFRFDVLYAEGDVTRHGGLCLGVKWEARCERGDCWRPAKCDGWKLNDGTEPEGTVDVVLRSGDDIPACDSDDLGWSVFDDGLSVLWWRPAASAVTEEPETKENDMSEVNDGWIKCMAVNEPLEGFRFDVLYKGKALCGSRIPPISWSRRVANGGYWRPAADEGWKLNDETVPDGMVDVVLRYGGMILDCDAVDLGWNVFEDTHSILWWRPSEDATEGYDSSLLGNLISATDDHALAVDRWNAANKAIRVKMGVRDRVIMRHDGELYLVEWDTAETVSWVQIDEI